MNKDKNKKKILIVIIALLMLVIPTAMVFIMKNNKKYTTLYDVKLNDKVDNNMFAIMLETGKNSGMYRESENDKWPTNGYVYNKEKSGCIDSNGKKIEDENVLVFDEKTHIATVETEVTAYCYLYFDKLGAGDAITNTNPSGLWKSTVPNDELEYRYQGKTVDNYICIGVESCSTTNNADNLYRIIGITSDGRIKVIRNTSIGAKQWHSINANVTWSGSSLKSYLNNDWFKNLNQSIKDLIFENTTWKSWTSSDVNNEGTTLYGYENGTNNVDTSTGAIGLMQISDCYLSQGNTARSCAESWMRNSFTGWTISRYGYYSATTYYTAWRLLINGEVSKDTGYVSNNVNPVFYLKSASEMSFDSVSDYAPGNINNPFIAK